MKNKKAGKLVVRLSGGLGNQLFQYAAARNICDSNGLSLVLDNLSGFWSDRLYRRTYELGNLSIRGREIAFDDFFPRLMDKALNLVSPRKGLQRGKIFRTEFYGNFLRETDYRYLHEIESLRLSGVTTMEGYWQSERYFRKIADQIKQEVTPPPPKKVRFIKLGEKITASPSIALGLRLYEESSNPDVHARDRKSKTMAAFNRVLLKALELRKDATVYVFCTHRNARLAELALPASTVYVTHDDGYIGSIERLWLLTLCQDHVFNNSSFYWWGAWLSSSNSFLRSQNIFCSDNFVNKDAICGGWIPF